MRLVIVGRLSLAAAPRKPAEGHPYSSHMGFLDPCGAQDIVRGRIL